MEQSLAQDRRKTRNR